MFRNEKTSEIIVGVNSFECVLITLCVTFKKVLCLTMENFFMSYLCESIAEVLSYRQVINQVQEKQNEIKS